MVLKELLSLWHDESALKEIFHMLMGDEVPPRKAFIQAHAKSVKNLDV